MSIVQQPFSKKSSVDRVIIDINCEIQFAQKKF